MLHKLQTAICSAVHLYAQKYEEETEKYLQTIIGDVWNLLLKLGPDTRYDAVRNYTRFFFSFSLFLTPCS